MISRYTVIKYIWFLRKPENIQNTVNFRKIVRGRMKRLASLFEHWANQYSTGSFKSSQYYCVILLTMGSGSSVAYELSSDQKVALTKLIEDKYLTLQKEKTDDVEIYQTLKS